MSGQFKINFGVEGFYIRKGIASFFSALSCGKVQRKNIFSSICDNKNFLSMFSSDVWYQLNYEKGGWNCLETRIKSVHLIPWHRSNIEKQNKTQQQPAALIRLNYILGILLLIQSAGSQ